MSLRAEYSWSATYEHLRAEDWTSGWHLIVRHKGKNVGYEWVTNPHTKNEAANRLISAHMEKVTRSLGLGSRALVTPEEDEEQDRLAHKADHDNQCEKDLE
jgi:hypothetical protein